MPDRTAAAPPKRPAVAGRSTRRAAPRHAPDAAALSEQNERFAIAFENMSHGICMFDAAERMVCCNGHYVQMFGLDPDFMTPGISLWDILNHSVMRSVTSVTTEELYNERKDFIQRREPASYAEILADGRVIAITHRPLADGGWVSIYEDITERRNGEMALQEQYRRFEAALSNMSQGLLMFDSETRLIVRNARYLQMFGLTAEDQPLGATRRELLQVLVTKGIYADFDIERAVDENRREIGAGRTLSVFRELGDGRTIAVSHNPMAGGGWVATFDDVTESRRAEASIRHMAHHDTLTGLANRARFSDNLDHLLALSASGDKPSAVFSLDLDRFKAVNDTLGHAVGDMILKLVAERLRGVVRNGPDAVARLGGDEFAVLLSDTDRDGAEQWARRATDVISQPYAVEGRHVSIGVSMGIAIAPRDGNAQDRLLKNADLALYRAKRESGSTFRFYDEGMDARRRQRNALEMDLREALQRREFEVHYQPVIRAADQQVVGFEALLRWRRRRRRMIPPSDFIPLAEETSLIVPIGEWVLAQACAEAMTWPSDLLLAVNVSAVQFQRSDFSSRVAEVLASSGLPAHRLELEITETVLMDHADSVLPTITALRRIGVRIALDDFGTGYSSLSYLRKFPFDRIKIDRSFIAEIDNADTAAIVATIVGLGRRLGMATTAEGVETIEQLQMARAAGCSDAQGYLISPAVPRDKIAGLLGQGLCSPAA